MCTTFGNARLAAYAEKSTEAGGRGKLSKTMMPPFSWICCAETALRVEKAAGSESAAWDSVVKTFDKSVRSRLPGAWSARVNRLNDPGLRGDKLLARRGGGCPTMSSVRGT
jgi:hypothetical protein